MGRFNITRNYHSFGCSIYTDTIQNAIFIINISNNAGYNKAHSLIGKPYLVVIASNFLPVFRGLTEVKEICHDKISYTIDF